VGLFFIDQFKKNICKLQLSLASLISDKVMTDF